MAEIGRAAAPFESMAAKAEQQGRYYEAADFRIKAGNALLAPLLRHDEKVGLEKLGEMLSAKEGRIYGYPIVKLAERAQRHFEKADADVAALIAERQSDDALSRSRAKALLRKARRRGQFARGIVQQMVATNDAFDQQP